MPTNDIPILVKPGLARIGDEWHPHLANSAGRPRCGALLNLREWQLRTVAQPPDELCARCARLLGPRASRRAPPRRTPDDPGPAQLGLPLDDDEPDW